LTDLITDLLKSPRSALKMFFFRKQRSS